MCNSDRLSQDDMRKFKRETLCRLQEYRNKNGLGSLERLSKISQISTTVLYDMLDCASVNLELWKRVSCSLNQII